MNKNFKVFFLKRTKLALNLSENADFQKSLGQAFSVISAAVKNGNKVLIFGNGGSAAQAQHFAAELVCKYKKERNAIPAIALTTDTSILTAQSNDVGFDEVFARQIEALCNAGDVVIGLTTSDAYENDHHSKNILLGFKEARKRGAKTVGLFSGKTKNLVSLVDVPIIIPSIDISLIQESHLAVIHLLSWFLEERLEDFIQSEPRRRE